MRRWFGLWGAALFCVLVLSQPVFAASDPVVDALDNITMLQRPRQIGYATISDGNKFVQCHRLQSGQMRCEAAGSRLQPSLEHVLTPERRAALDARGWYVEPAFDLYQRTFAADQTLETMAAAIKLALVQGYAAEPAHFEIRTQWVEDVACPPRLGYSQTRAGSIDNSPAVAAVTIRQCLYTPDPQRAPSGPVASLEAMVQMYGPRLTAEIQRLRINAPTAKHVIVHAGIGYVQCAPELEPTAIYCEAESVASWPALAALLTPERIARLHAADYNDPGRVQNYWKIYAIERMSDDAIAREVLGILFDVYGFRGPHALVFTAR